jgi:hypothetical protein
LSLKCRGNFRWVSVRFSVVLTNDSRLAGP